MIRAEKKQYLSAIGLFSPWMNAAFSEEDPENLTNSPIFVKLQIPEIAVVLTPNMRHRMMVMGSLFLWAR